MKKKRVLSGIQPSGRLHLGNLIGALENWKKLQDKYECFFEIADLHALTTSYEDTHNFSTNIKEVFIDLLSIGLDPDKATIFLQSDIPEHSELHLILSMITPLGWLERIPSYKSKIQELKDRDLGTYGFLGYPVLQAADILIYKAEVVPVGQDQLPHIEITREIARRFNFLYKKEVFPLPKEELTNIPTLPGLDGRKMSKTYGNTINLSDSKDMISQKIMTMITDPQRIKKNDPGHPEICGVFAYQSLFNAKEKDKIEKACKKSEIGCVDCKKLLAQEIIKKLLPIQEKRQELDPNKIALLLKKGQEKASCVAKETLIEVKKAVGLN